MDRRVDCYEPGQHLRIFGQISAWEDWLMMVMATTFRK